MSQKLPNTRNIQIALRKLTDPVRAKILAGFFKTGKGEYGEGDKFLGITVPTQRKVAKEYGALPLGEISELLASPVHEHRFTALEILVMQYERGDQKAKRVIFNFYLKHTPKINNWDLVDTSAPYIVGDYLLNQDRKILYRLAKSKNLWERRIAIVSTYALIRQKQFADALKLTELLMNDKHDLIHKACGWMLREVGNRSLSTLTSFLNRHAHKMPRTMLRYAIEKLPLVARKQYLSQKTLD